MPSSLSSSDWWIYLVIAIVVLLLLGLIIGLAVWLGRRRDREPELARSRDEAGNDNDTMFSPSRAMTSEYASATSALAPDSVTPSGASVAVYGKAPSLPDEIIYDCAL